MESLGILPNNSTLPIVLKACSRLQAVERGKKIHKDVLDTDLIDDVRVRTALVDFYCKCGFPEDARWVFDEMPEKDVVSWNSMISGCVGCCGYKEAILLFKQMQREDMKANSVTVVALLVACRELLDLRLGKEVHGYCLRNGLFDSNPHVGTALMGFYLRFDVRIASLVFELMGLRNIVSWNALISGYFDVGESSKALELFVLMLMDGLNCDSVTMLVVIQACAELGSLQLGMQVHQMAIKFDFSDDLYVVSALMNMYSKIGSLKSSCDIFKYVPTRDAALWNSLISAYVESGSLEEAMSSFNQMRLEGIREDERTAAIMMPLYADLPNGLKNGKGLHAYVIKSGMEINTCLGNAVLNMYAELNCVEDAVTIFHKINDRDAISWNTLILALARNRLRGQAWEMFMQMHESDNKPNSHTIISILAAFDEENFLNIGRSVHGYVIKHGIEIDSSLNTALTEMYLYCGDEATARYLFECFGNKDLIAWNSLIGSYVNKNQSDKAMLVFHQMISEVKPNSVTIINVLSSCTHLANLPQGKCLHAYAIRRTSSLGFDLFLANAFVTMYSRCGSMQYAEKIFRAIPNKNVVSWNAIIACYGMHGCGHDAMLAFEQMLEDGFEPNRITFVSALSACSHSGLIDMGLDLFHSMVHDFHTHPEVVHYACVVDLLGRGGFLDEAQEVINSMPVEPDACVWRALLGACRVHSKTELAKPISEKLIELEPTNAANYILLSNIYAAAGLWSEVQKLRETIEENCLKKPPGKSWIAFRGEIHCFTAADRSHAQSDKIYAKLSSVLSLIKETGYVPDLRWVLHDETDEEKKKRLFSHSEKLAISFGLISFSTGNPILVTKNLRVCGDCHEFSKHVSKLVGREIVLRDGSRFHHFVNGFCSCGDYW